LNHARGKLHHRLNVLLEVHAVPIIVFKIKIKHIIGNLSILVLSSKNNHRVAVDRATMILSWLHADSLCFYDIDAIVRSVEYHHLVDALTNLPLAIVHVAASEAVDLAF